MAAAEKEAGMRVEGILRSKGGDVHTIRPDDPVTVAIDRLTANSIGALVVTLDERVVGILSERDIVQALSRYGAALLDRRVGEVMEARVATCSPRHHIVEVMGAMTRTRQRHLPVVENDRVVGIISIGDVVKHRLGELELETNVLRDIHSSRHNLV